MSIKGFLSSFARIVVVVVAAFKFFFEYDLFVFMCVSGKLCMIFVKFNLLLMLEFLVLFVLCLEIIICFFGLSVIVVRVSVVRFVSF